MVCIEIQQQKVGWKKQLKWWNNNYETKLAKNLILASLLLREATTSLDSHRNNR